MALGEFLNLIAVYQVKNEGAEIQEKDTRTRSQKLDALAGM